MIKIQEHLNRDDADEYLDSLANHLWEFLNQKNINGEYNANSLIKKLDNFRIEIDNPEYLIQIADNDIVKLNSHKQFIDYLRSDDYNIIKKVIVSKPQFLFDFKNYVNENYIQTIFFSTKGSVIQQTAFGNKLISDIFNYNNFRKSQFCFQLIRDYNMNNVKCPYCNMTDIHIIDISDEENENEVLRAYMDIDHFYPKSQFPYFALSFYNLIPSCHNCNSIEKGAKEFCITTHQHPFHESFNDNYEFQVNSDFIITRSITNIDLEKKIEREDFTVRDFKLKQRYSVAENELNEFVNRYLDYSGRKYNAPYDKYYLEAVLKDVPHSNNDILKKRFGKLYRDVFNLIDKDKYLEMGH